MNQQERSVQKFHIADHHEHDPLPPGLLPGASSVASANECTGLMTSPPENAAQLEAYQELSPMAIPRKEPGAPRPKACPGTGKRMEKRQ